jgi:hypothetical protein
MSIFGSPNFEKMIEKRDIKGITRLLTDKNWKIRLGAAEACEKLAPYFDLPPASAGEIQYHWHWKLEANSNLFLNIPINEDEAIVGIPLPVRYRDDSQYHIGRRGSNLLAGMCEKDGDWAGSRYPSWNFLALILTNQRTIVVSYHWSHMISPYWADSLENLLEINILKEDEEFIELRFNDAKFGEDELVFKPLDELMINFTDMENRDIPEWLKECNHFLQLFHRKGDELSLYLQYDRAVKKQALTIVDSLIKNMKDEQSEVRNATTSALKAIGGMQAEKALTNNGLI